MRSYFKNLILAFLWNGVHRKALIERPTILALTGSVGKTTTKEVVADVWEKSGRAVLRTYGNLNTEFGVAVAILGFKAMPSSLGGWFKLLWKALFPTTLLTLPGKRPFYVVEYSADKPGDIGFLAKQLPLHYAAITRIVPAHMQSYPTFEDLVKEKVTILTGLNQNGLAILNADDPAQKEAGRQQSQVLWYGLRSSVPKLAGVWGWGVTLKNTGLEFNISFVTSKAMDSIGMNQSQTIHVQTSLIGRHHLYSLLVAAAAGWQERIAPEKIKEALEAYTVPAGRGRIIEGRKDITIIDETYNSSPEAVKQGLDMLQDIRKQVKRCVVILGNMNELGSFTDKAHEEVARYAANKADFLVFVGPQGAKMATAAQDAGQPQGGVMSFKTPEQLIDKIEQVVKREDLLYIKGSQNGVRLERAVKALMAHPDQAAHLLVRQQRP